MPDHRSESLGSRKAEMKFIFSQVTHPGDGQGLVEVFPAYHAEAPGGRTVQHHAEWHDPLMAPGRGSEQHRGEVREPRSMGGMETLEAWGRGQGRGWTDTSHPGRMLLVGTDPDVGIEPFAQVLQFWLLSLFFPITLSDPINP